MIVGIISVRNEAPIIETTLRHHLESGLDHIIVSDAMSTDGTREAIWRLGDAVTLYDDDSMPFIQEREMSFLAARAGEMGADWVCPFDSDEFIAPMEGGTIASVLNGLGTDARKLFMPVFRHLDWDHRELVPEIPRKVVFRWEPGATLIVGQHDCSVEPAWPETPLCVRELKYRSPEHFRSKIAAHLETMRPEWGEQYATHVQKFRGASDAEMAAAWEQMASVETIYDPIPSTLKGLI